MAMRNIISYSIEDFKFRSLPKYLNKKNKNSICYFSFKSNFRSKINPIYSFEDPQVEDNFAILSDWNMTGEDLKFAIEKFKSELQKEITK